MKKRTRNAEKKRHFITKVRYKNLVA